MGAADQIEKTDQSTGFPGKMTEFI